MKVTVGQVLYGMALAFFIFTIMNNAEATELTCTSGRGFDPNVCNFDPLRRFPQGPVSCRNANIDTFTVPFILGIFAAQDTCISAIIFDGPDCMQAWGNYACSQACQYCSISSSTALLPCDSLCGDLLSVCPTANNLGCLGNIQCSAGGPNQCMSITANMDLNPTQTTVPITTTMPTTTTAPTSAGGRMDLNTLWLFLGTALIILASNYQAH